MKVYGLPTCMILGAGAATLGAFPVASLVALVYRFPIPFRGYASGFGAIVPANFAVLVYGLLGGFIVLPFSGAVAAALTHWATRLTETRGRAVLYWVVGFALIADLIAAIALSLLDKIIGPW